MRSTTLTLELTPVEYEVQVYYHYYPPKDPGGFGFRVSGDVEVVHVDVLSVTTEQGTFLRRELKIPKAADIKAYNHILNHWDKYVEQLINA